MPHSFRHSVIHFASKLPKGELRTSLIKALVTASAVPGIPGDWVPVSDTDIDRGGWEKGSVKLQSAKGIYIYNKKKKTLRFVGQGGWKDKTWPKVMSSDGLVAMIREHQAMIAKK